LSAAPAEATTMPHAPVNHFVPEPVADVVPATLTLPAL
jgi:hypothetical protein